MPRMSSWSEGDPPFLAQHDRNCLAVEPLPRVAEPNVIGLSLGGYPDDRIR